MRILDKPISKAELSKIAENTFGDMVKAAVDIDRDKLAIDAEMHSDLEQLLLDDGSTQSSLWGINLYPDAVDLSDFVEFDSLINIRPKQNNRGMGVYDESVRKQIFELVSRWTYE